MTPFCEVTSEYTKLASADCHMRRPIERCYRLAVLVSLLGDARRASLERDELVLHRARLARPPARVRDHATAIELRDRRCIRWSPFACLSLVVPFLRHRTTLITPRVAILNRSAISISRSTQSCKQVADILAERRRSRDG